MRAMKLADYLRVTDSSYRSFAERITARLAAMTGQGRTISDGTIRAIANGGGCRSDMAAAIIAESRANPAPDGAYVTLEDLVRQQVAS